LASALLAKIKFNFKHMKNIIPILAVASVFMVSCQSNSTTDTANNDSSSTKDSSPVNNSICYAYYKNRDTATLKLITSAGKVSGDLRYSLYEKDSNKGTIEGIVKGDTIIADYAFNSEGMQSIRQVVWLRKDGKLLEGFGEQEQVGNKTRFKNIAQLKFADSIEFSAVDCK